MMTIINKFDLKLNFLKISLQLLEQLFTKLEANFSPNLNPTILFPTNFDFEQKQVN